MGLVTRNFADIFSFSRGSAGTDTDAAGKLASFANDVLRMGYDPITGAPLGWLIEGAATNNLTQTSNLADPVWTARLSSSAVALAGAAGLAPDGTLSAAAFTEDTSNAFRAISWNQTAGFVDQQSSVWSIYVKQKPGSAPRHIVLYNNTPGRFFAGALGTRAAGFNLTTGAIAAKHADYPAAGITPLGNDRYRCWLAFPPYIGGSGAVGMRIQLVDDANVASTAQAGSHDGDGSSGVLLWGMQLEPGTFPTSYIPTAGSPVTRSADNLRIDGSRFTNLFGAGAPKGCVIADVLLNQAAPAGVFPLVFALYGGTTSVYSVTNSPTALGGLGFRVNGSSSLGPFTPGTPFRIGMRWGGDTVSGCFNAGPIQTVSAAPAAVPDSLFFGVNPSGQLPLNGRIRLARALAYAPADTEFRALCTPGA